MFAQVFTKTLRTLKKFGSAKTEEFGLQASTYASAHMKITSHRLCSWGSWSVSPSESFGVCLESAWPRQRLRVSSPRVVVGPQIWHNPDFWLPEAAHSIIFAIRLSMQDAVHFGASGTVPIPRDGCLRKTAPTKITIALPENCSQVWAPQVPTGSWDCLPYFLNMHSFYGYNMREGAKEEPGLEFGVVVSAMGPKFMEERRSTKTF